MQTICLHFEYRKESTVLVRCRRDWKDLETIGFVSCRSRTFSEGQLQAALHLTGLALREEEARQQDKSRTAFEFGVKAQESYRLLSVLESLQTNGRVDVHRPLLMWTIRKFRSVHSAAQVHSHYSITVLLTLLNTTNSTLYHSLTALRKDLVRLWKPSQPKGPDRNHRRKLQLVSAKLKWS